MEKGCFNNPSVQARLLIPALLLAGTLACGEQSPKDTSVLPAGQALSAGRAEDLLPEEQRERLGEAYARRGSAAVLRADYERAVYEYGAAIALVTDVPFFYTDRALAMVLLGRDEDAREDLESAMRLGARPRLTFDGVRVFSCDDPTSRGDEARRLDRMSFRSAVIITGRRFCPQGTWRGDPRRATSTTRLEPGPARRP